MRRSMVSSRFRSTRRRPATEWARGQILNQSVAAGAIFTFNLLSGFETDTSQEFRGVVKGLMQSLVSSTVTGAAQVAMAIGVFPEGLTMPAGYLFTGNGRTYQWMWYRRIHTFVTPSATDSITAPALCFDTNTKSARRIRSKNEQLAIVVDNAGAGAYVFNHWSNILVQRS